MCGCVCVCIVCVFAHVHAGVHVCTCVFVYVCLRVSHMQFLEKCVCLSQLQIVTVAL